MSVLSIRDAVHDFDHVPARLLIDNGPGCNPVITIAIPTFNRPELAQEAIASAISQSGDIPFEIVVVDNASDERNVRLLSEAINRLTDVPIRYFVNEANIGMFPNWNRCIEKARGRFLTILNDDDLLRPNFLLEMFKHVDLTRDDVVYACAVETLDQRIGKRGTNLRQRIGIAINSLSEPMRSESFPVTARSLFWSHASGTGLGMIFSRNLLVQLGGFYPEDFPTSDYYLHVRVVVNGQMIKVCQRLATVRLQVNESQRPAVLLGFIGNNYRLRMALIRANLVPAEWRRFLPALIGYERRSFARMWGVALTRQDVENATGTVEAPAPVVLILLRRWLFGR